MADVIHEHTAERDGGGMGFFLGVAIFLVALMLLIFIVLPYIRNTTSTPQINVPGKIDVNVNQPK